MRPTQRNLMKKSIPPLSLLSSAISPVVAGQDVGIVANIKNNICQGGVSDNGNIDLSVVGMDDFTGNISAKNHHSGGKGLITTVQDCTLQGTGNVLNQLHINFCAFSGVMATGSSQVFASEGNAGAKNTGVVISSIQDLANTLDAPSATGSSRPVYPVTSPALNNSSRKFSTRT